MVPENKHVNTDYDQMRSDLKCTFLLFAMMRHCSSFRCLILLVHSLTLTLSNEVTVVIVASCIDTGGHQQTPDTRQLLPSSGSPQNTSLL